MPLGDQGEDQVRLWASAAGFLVNSSHRDRAGWDHLLDLSEPRDSHPNENLLGVASRSLSARVQVKSTRSRRRKVSISLSNLQRAIEDPLPWIYLIIRYERESSVPAEVAALHLDRELIERVLEHIHALTPADLRRMHRKKYALTWTPKDILQTPVERSLRALIEACVPNDLLAYASAKKNWIETAGFPAKPVAEVKFSVVASTEEELYRRISRAAIGLEEAIAISGLQYTRERFGVMRPDPKFPDAPEAKIGMMVSDDDKEWTLSVIDHLGSRFLDVPVSFRFSGAVIPHLPEKYWLSRIQTPFVDIVADHGTQKLSVSLELPPNAEPVRVADLADSLALMVALVDRSGQPISLRVSKDQRWVPLLPANCEFELAPEFKEFAGGAGELNLLMRELGVSADTQMSMSDIGRLGPVARFIRGARHRSALPVTLAWPASALPHLSPNERAAVIVDAPLPIGNALYVDLVLIRGNIIEDSTAADPHFMIVSNDLSTLGTYKYALTERDKFPFDELAKAAEEKLALEGIKTVLLHRL